MMYDELIDSVFFFSLFETDMEFAGIFGLFRISESVAIGARVHELVAWFL